MHKTLVKLTYVPEKRFKVLQHYILDLVGLEGLESSSKEILSHIVYGYFGDKILNFEVRVNVDLVTDELLPILQDAEREIHKALESLLPKAQCYTIHTTDNYFRRSSVSDIPTHYATNLWKIFKGDYRPIANYTKIFEFRNSRSIIESIEPSIERIISGWRGQTGCQYEIITMHGMSNIGDNIDSLALFVNPDFLNYQTLGALKILSDNLIGYGYSNAELPADMYIRYEPRLGYGTILNTI